MAGKHFGGEIAEDAGKLQKHLEQQLSDEGPHEDLLEIQEILEAAPSRWHAMTNIKHPKELVGNMSSALAEILGVDP
jgi:hypothetical protein